MKQKQNKKSCKLFLKYKFTWYKIAEGETNNLGDPSNQLDPSLVDVIKDGKL